MWTSSEKFGMNTCSRWLRCLRRIRMPRATRMHEHKGPGFKVLRANERPRAGAGGAKFQAALQLLAYSSARSYASFRRARIRLRQPSPYASIHCALRCKRTPITQELTMRTTFAMTLALAAALTAAACGRADAPSGPIAATNVPSTNPPESAMTPPVTRAPEVPLPPLPANITAITASPEQPASAPTARDTPANDPKGPLTAAEEYNAMPKAAHGNNHSSPSLEKSPQQ